MTTLIIVGGFFGDEGKGKIAGYLALKDRPNIGVRCGSVNAGHTVIYRDSVWKLRLVPSFFLNAETLLMLSAGTLLRLDVLAEEMKATNTRGRLYIDEKAGIIEDRHVLEEGRDSLLSNFIGSTRQGVGYAMADRVLRRLKLARDMAELKEMVIDVSAVVNESVERGDKVYIEGVQGTFLSLYHGTYPFVTSRDTTASAFASEVGIGPKKVNEIVLVFKSYVTRVGEGPLPNELSYEEVERRGWAERGTVTNRPRRAAEFNIELARRAVMLNSPTQIAITRIDALFRNALGVTDFDRLTREAKNWIEWVEEQLKVPVTLIGTGPDVLHTIDLRREKLGPS